MTKRSFVAAAALTSCITGSAMAADLPAKAYRPFPAEVFSWSGFYVGGHLGYGWSSNDWKVDDGIGTFNIGSGTINGALGGAQVGVNWQTGPVVLGIEADFSLADMSGETCNFTLGGSFLCSSKVERFGTITGRIGGAFDRTLLYLKAGGAWVRDTIRWASSLGIRLRPRPANPNGGGLVVPALSMRSHITGRLSSSMISCSSARSATHLFSQPFLPLLTQTSSNASTRSSSASTTGSTGVARSAQATDCSAAPRQLQYRAVKRSLGMFAIFGHVFAGPCDEAPSREEADAQLTSGLV